jgi:hypothetical protein
MFEHIGKRDHACRRIIRHNPCSAAALPVQ